MAHPKPWHMAEKGEVHKAVLSYVESVESAQADLFDRFVKLDALYDSALAAGNGNQSQAMISTNVIATNVDTVHAVITTNDVRARFMTDDGDWSTQRQARHLEMYADGLSDLLDVDPKCQRGFKSCALKGTGLNKVFIDAFDRIQVERVMVDDIVVDEAEVRAGKPRQMHQRMILDIEDLKASFPEHEEEIDRAPTGRAGSTQRLWADYRPVERNEVVCLESWYLPIGVKGKKGYRPGRHTIVYDGGDLLDEEYDDDFFPFAKIVWSERESGWYGIGLAERIVGHQRVINKSNWQADRQLDQLAVPTTYVSVADANIAVKTRGPLGTIAVTRSGQPPVTVTPQAVSPETYKRIADATAGAFEESGVSRMAAQSVKPAGIDSGVAMREYRDQTTQRFAPQEKAYERFKLDTMFLVLHCAKRLGKKAPVVVRKSKFGPQQIDWPSVDMGEVKVQIAAASNLSKTPAGRLQLALEWAQAGVISQDEARRLMRHPDTERSMSLYTAALEDIERCIEEILDGAVLVPEPYQNLKMGIWRFQQAYLKARDDGAPEDILEALRQWIVIAADTESKATVANQNVAMGAAPMDPAMAGAGGMPPMDPAMAGAAAGPPMGDMGAAMAGAGVQPMTFAA